MQDLTYGDLERARQLSLAQAQGLAEVIGPMLEAHKPAESPEAERKRWRYTFAACAMQGIVKFLITKDEHAVRPFNEREIASQAVCMADALMEELECTDAR